MPVFKLTTSDGGIQGGATRAEGLDKLRVVTQEDALKMMRELRTNLRGSDGLPKHGVLKLRHSSSAGTDMEFARMRGMDRWFSQSSTFQNTREALKILMVRAGIDEAAATKLLTKYSSSNGSLKYKRAVEMLGEARGLVLDVKPEIHSAKTMKGALEKAGVELPDTATSYKPGNTASKTQKGAFGTVYEGTDGEKACMFKRLESSIKIQLDDKGRLLRGQQLDGNHLVSAKVPGVIAPTRYVVKETTPGTRDSQYHIVSGGRDFKAFCREQASKPTGEFSVVGLLMDKAAGTRMREARPKPEELQQIAKGFASILMNASAHGIVFGDIKPENAFVDGGKLTLIDTDGAIKRSKWADKAQESMQIASTYKHPASAGGNGLQQDLWSVGFSLLEASHPERSDALFDVGSPKAAPVIRNVNLDDLEGNNRPRARPPRVDKDAILAQIVTVLGNAPEPGGVDDFALLCIRTALSTPDRPYMKRFTDDGRHLLDPILAHPLLEGRDTFIQDNMVRKGPELAVEGDRTQEILRTGRAEKKRRTQEDLDLEIRAMSRNLSKDYDPSS